MGKKRQRESVHDSADPKGDLPKNKKWATSESAFDMIDEITSKQEMQKKTKLDNTKQRIAKIELIEKTKAEKKLVRQQKKRQRIDEALQHQEQLKKARSEFRNRESADTPKPKKESRSTKPKSVSFMFSAITTTAQPNDSDQNELDTEDPDEVNPQQDRAAHNRRDAITYTVDSVKKHFEKKAKQLQKRRMLAKRKRRMR